MRRSTAPNSSGNSALKYRPSYSREAESYLRRLPKDVAARIFRRVRQICDDPFDLSLSKPLRGRLANRRSSRIGDYRILFEVINDELVVLVIRVGPRGDVYKD